MHANIFGELQLSCIRVKKKKQGLSLDPQRVITEIVAEPFEPIKVTGVSNAYRLSGKRVFTQPIMQRQNFGLLPKIEKKKVPTYFESKVLLLHKNGFEPDKIANQLRTALLPVNNAIRKWTTSTTS